VVSLVNLCHGMSDGYGRIPVFIFFLILFVSFVLLVVDRIRLHPEEHEGHEGCRRESLGAFPGGGSGSVEGAVKKRLTTFIPGIYLQIILTLVSFEQRNLMNSAMIQAIHITTAAEALVCALLLLLLGVGLKPPGLMME